MAKGDDLQERFARLAAAIILLCKAIPKDDGAKHLAGQLLRSGTSPAPNYAEARGAESDRDFVHKLKIVLKELNETIQWLQVGIWKNIWSREQVAGILEAVHDPGQDHCGKYQYSEEKGRGGNWQKRRTTGQFCIKSKSSGFESRS